jgi:hypothetical protein
MSDSQRLTRAGSARPISPAGLGIDVKTLRGREPRVSERRLLGADTLHAPLKAKQGSARPRPLSEG